MEYIGTDSFEVPYNIWKLETHSDKAILKDLEDLYSNEDNESESIYFSRMRDMIHMEEMAQLKRMAAYDLENVQLRVKSHKNRTLTVVEVNKVIKNNFFEYLKCKVQN